MSTLTRFLQLMYTYVIQYVTLVAIAHTAVNLIAEKVSDFFVDVVNIGNLKKGLNFIIYVMTHAIYLQM